MRIRPFLSHKRQDALIVSCLKRILQLYGAGGWKDTDDLRMGASTEAEIRRAIFEDTGGFIWWGTQRALSSEVINQRSLKFHLFDVATERVGHDVSHLRKNTSNFFFRNVVIRRHFVTPS